MTQDNRLAVQSLDDCWNHIGVWSKAGASCPQLESCVHCRNCDHYASAGRLMLERPAPDDYRRQWTDRFARPKQAAEAATDAGLLFRLGDEWFALSSRYVSEVTKMLSIHSLPHCSENLVKGLVNIRGELKLCISIGSALQLDKASSAHFTDHEILERMVLIEKDDQSFVFPVSEVEGIIHYPEHDLLALPPTLANARSKLTTAVVKWRDNQVGILDHELLFYSLAKGLT